MSCDRTEQTLSTFYRTERAGAAHLSDGGGPFGFDVTVALLVDDLIVEYSCDAIVETGCFLGDTTSYLARRYPEFPIYSCDINGGYESFTRHRMAENPNVTVSCVDSPLLVAAMTAKFQRPLFFLDAHWDTMWPLARELDAIGAGIVVIHDFDIGHPRFAFDTYQGVACGPVMFASMAAPPERYFTPDPDADHPLPCLQTGRRAGVGIAAIGLDPALLDGHPHLRSHPTPDPASASAVLGR